MSQQMELVKRRARSLSMRLLVQLAKRHRICEQLVELRGHFQTTFYKVTHSL